MGLPVIGKMLGHTQAATTARYAHLASDPVKVAAATVAVAFLELVFTYDGTRGGPLVLLTVALVLVALDLPLLIGSSVASYSSGSGASQA